MLSTPSLSCALCGSAELQKAYTDSWRGRTYTGYHCRSCDLYQTLGEIEVVSPEYESLTEADLTEHHVFLQTKHKVGAFAQWMKLMEKHGNRPLSGTLLDIGCGVGGFLDYAGSHGLDTFGFDASRAQVERVRQKHPNVGRFDNLDEYAATLPEGTQFDYITMWDVLEHIRNPEILLDSIRKYLKPNGLLFVSIPNGGPIPIRLKIASLFNTPLGLIPWEHVFFYTRRSLRALMEKNKYQVVDISGVVAYPRKISPHEVLRRVAFRALLDTRYALQLYAVVR